MLLIEKKIYGFIDKYLPYIVAFVVAIVVLFMNRQVLYCVRPYEGADMWEASKVFVHSPLHVLILRKIWIEMFHGSYEFYRMLFWVFSYSVAILGAIVFCQCKKKQSHVKVLETAAIVFCFTLITPLALIYGPVMLHMDGISMTLLLLGIALSNIIHSKWKVIPFAIGVTLAITLQTNYMFLALAMMIYGIVKKNKIYISIAVACVLLSIILNILIGSYMGFSVPESIHMILRFFYISQATGMAFTSVFSWFLYMVFWNGYWIGMISLFAAFRLTNKVAICTFLHIVLFFFATVIFFNGYF